MSGTPDTTTPAVTEEDRAKAFGIMTASPPRTDINPYWRIDAIAAALAAERGKADALRAAMHALAEELGGEHEAGCCAGGDCLLGGEHTHPDDPVRITELVGAWSDDPPPLREHRMIPCPRKCTCPAGPLAARLRAIADGQR